MEETPATILPEGRIHQRIHGWISPLPWLSRIGARRTRRRRTLVELELEDPGTLLDLTKNNSETHWRMEEELDGDQRTKLDGDERNNFVVGEEVWESTPEAWAVKSPPEPFSIVMCRSAAFSIFLVYTLSQLHPFSFSCSSLAVLILFLFLI